MIFLSSLIAMNCVMCDVFTVAKLLVQILMYELHAGSRVERIDPLCFLAGCRAKRLNQALSVLSLSFDVCVN